MTRLVLFAFSVLTLAVGTIPCIAGHSLEVIERSKKATALVEVVTAEGAASGSAFCIDRSGLFITNAHVVRGGTSVRLIIEIGQKSQRRLRARVLRADDERDLALLQADGDAGLTPLELGRDDTLRETAPIFTFGFPFGKRLRVGDEAYPDITVISSRITALRRDKGQLEGIQFDNQLNPGNSGGPVVDEVGRVVGVAVATVPGAAINLAIPVGRLSEFLGSPGLVFDPPPLAYKDRSRPVSWTIRVQPPTPSARLPEKLSVTVTIANAIGAPRSFTAQPIGDGVFRVKVTPVPHDPDLRVHLDVRFPDGRAVPVEVKDRTVSVGGTRFLLSDLQTLLGGPVPRVFSRRGATAVGPIAGLGKTRIPVGKKSVTVDLDAASQIFVRPLDAPPTVRAIEALVEARQGTKVLATVLKRADFSDVPAPNAVAVRVGRGVVILPVNPSPPLITASQGPPDDGLVAIGGTLDVDGVPRGAGGSIRPPAVEMGEARGDASPVSDEPREVRKLLGHRNQVMDLVLSPDGRFLVTCDLDGIIRVWNAETGANLYTFGGHRGRLYALAMSPDGRRVLSGGEDQVLRLWDIEQGQFLREYRGHGDGIYAIAFTPDGRRCLSAGGGRPGFVLGTDREIWVRDVDDGRVMARWSGHTGIIDALAVSPDGKRALSSSSDQTARLWDVETGREIRRFAGQPELDLHAIFSPDGRRAIVTSAGHLVRIFEVESGREVLQLRGHTAKADSLAASPDGRVLISGSWQERTFRIWDLSDGRALGQIPLETNPQLGTFTPDGRRFFWSFTDRTVREFTLPAAAIRRPDARLADDPLVRLLDGKISDVTVGGGGRYLILTLREARKLAIFDVNAADIIKTIPLPSSNVLVAAGARRLVLAFPDQGLIQRRDLEALDQPARSFTSPIKARLVSLTMGHDSDGPLLAAWAPPHHPAYTDWIRFSLVDPSTMKVHRAGPLLFGNTNRMGGVSPSGGSFLVGSFPPDHLHVRASASGDLFALWSSRLSLSGFQSLALRRSQLTSTNELLDLRYLAPGPDGGTIYTGRAGALDAFGKPVGGPEPTSSPRMTIPASEPSYYLEVKGLEQDGSSVPVTGRISASIHASSDGDRLLTIQRLEEMGGERPKQAERGDDLTIDKRFHLIPAAHLLITIPFSDDRLVLRRLDLRKILEKSGRDYLVITSRSRLRVRAGRPLSHRIEAFSKAGGIRYTLARGPEGLVVSSDGELTWLPPKKSAGGQDATAVVTVADSSGLERFHTLRIRVD